MIHVWVSDRKQTDLIRMAASRWKRMSESERAPFEMEAVRDKSRYEQEMVEWVPVPLAEPIAQSPVSSNRHNLDGTESYFVCCFFVLGCWIHLMQNFLPSASSVLFLLLSNLSVRGGGKIFAFFSWCIPNTSFIFIDGNRTSSFNSRSGQSLSSDPSRGHFTSSSSEHPRSKNADRFLSVTPDKAKRVKKNSSAYMFFSKDMSVRLRKENPGLSQQAIMSKVGELWRKLDSSLREVRLVFLDSFVPFCLTDSQIFYFVNSSR